MFCGKATTTLHCSGQWMKQAWVKVGLDPRQWRNFGLKSGGTKLEVYLQSGGSVPTPKNGGPDPLALKLRLWPETQQP